MPYYYKVTTFKGLFNTEALVDCSLRTYIFFTQVKNARLVCIINLYNVILVQTGKKLRNYERTQLCRATCFLKFKFNNKRNYDQDCTHELVRTLNNLAKFELETYIFRFNSDLETPLRTLKLKISSNQCTSVPSTKVWHW